MQMRCDWDATDKSCSKKPALPPVTFALIAGNISYQGRGPGEGEGRGVDGGVDGGVDRGVDEGVDGGRRGRGLIVTESVINRAKQSIYSGRSIFSQEYHFVSVFVAADAAAAAAAVAVVDVLKRSQWFD